jgi:predicted DNA-binding transcriptional regulator YafY
MRNLVNQALMMSDDWVVEFCYRDSKENESIRVVSPIRFLGSDRFLALCLSREGPRQFYLSRCTDMAIRPAHDYVMPVPIRQLVAA